MHAGDHSYHNHKPTVHNKTRKQAASKTREIKIGYFNAQGKVGRYKKSIWSEIEGFLQKDHWDVLAMCETHWYGGVPVPSIPGYKLYHTQRSVDMKKGGGLAIYIKENIQSYQYQFPTLHPDDDSPYIATEITWIILPSKQGPLALGLVYLPSGRDNLNWRTKLHDTLLLQITHFTLQGMKTMLIGDFNGHLNQSTSDDLVGLDQNGRLLADIHNSGRMEIMNGKDICSGKYTWMRGNSKSVVDYVLMDPTLSPLCSNITIDEHQNRWSIGSDHCVIQTTLKWSYFKTSTTKKFTPRWFISQTTDWPSYQQKLQSNLKLWMTQYNNIYDGQDTDQAYDSFIQCIYQTADDTFPAFNTKPPR